MSTADTEPTGSQPSDAQPPGSQPSDAQLARVQSSVAQSIGVQSSDAQATGVQSPQIPSTMRAAVAHRPGEPLVIETSWPVPVPDPGEVLIRVIACGVCHSDVHALDGDWDPPATFPLIPGHEVTGEVVATGSGTEVPAVGDLVGVPWLHWACGRCTACLNGMETICHVDSVSTGYSQPGGYAEYMVAQAAFTQHLPRRIDPIAVAPILCAGVTVYRGLKRTEARPGQWVAVIGVGGLGHVAVQYARAMGMRVVAVDVDDAKLDHAGSLGAEVTVNSRRDDAVATMRQRVKGSGVDAAIVTAVHPSAFEQAPALLTPGGTVVFIGMPGGDGDLIRTSINGLVGGELTIRGSSVGTRGDLSEAIDFAARGLVTTTVTTAPLEDANRVLDDLRSGRIVGRVVLTLRE